MSRIRLCNIFEEENNLFNNMTMYSSWGNCRNGNMSDWKNVDNAIMEFATKLAFCTNWPLTWRPISDIIPNINYDPWPGLGLYKLSELFTRADLRLHQTATCNWLIILWRVSLWNYCKECTCLETLYWIIYTSLRRRVSTKKQRRHLLLLRLPTIGYASCLSCIPYNDAQAVLHVRSRMQWWRIHVYMQWEWISSGNQSTLFVRNLKFGLFPSVHALIIQELDTL